MSKFWKTKTMRVCAISAMVLLLVYIFLIAGFHPTRPDNSQNGAHSSIMGDTLYCTVIMDSKIAPGTPALKFAYDLIRRKIILAADSEG